METRTTIWFTGLPSSGKRLVAHALAEALDAGGHKVEVIDSVLLRQTPLGAKLGFSHEDRDQNAHRLAMAAHLLAKNGVVPIVVSVSPYADTRARVRKELGTSIELYVSTPREVCIERDEKGFWKKALAGEITDFTGVDDPYEAPTNPDVQVDTSVDGAIEQGVERVLALLKA